MPQPLLDRKTVGQDIALVESKSLSLEVMPRSFGELRELAQAMAMSDWLPAHFKGKPENCLLVCLQAYRWGMDPVAVAQQTYFAKAGQPSYMAQLIHALVLARAPLKGRLKIKFSGEWPNRVCTVSGKFQGDDEPQVYVIDAVTIKTRNSPLWVSDPDQQLAYFATRGWARRFAPDTIMGIYAPDEMQDVTTYDVPPPPAQSNGGFAAAIGMAPDSKLDALEELLAQQRPVGEAPEQEHRSFYRGEELTPPLGPLPEPPAEPVEEPPPPEAPEEPEAPEAPPAPPEAESEPFNPESDQWAGYGTPKEYVTALAERLRDKRDVGESAEFEVVLQIAQKYIAHLPPGMKAKLDTFVIASRERLRQTRP